jgi:hypothetical protein
VSATVSARDPLVAFSRITPIEWEDLRHTIGFLEGLDSERGIAWGLTDPLSLREFLGYGIDEFDCSKRTHMRRCFDPTRPIHPAQKNC